MDEKRALEVFDAAVQKAMEKAAHIAALKQKPLLTPREVEDLYGIRTSRLAKGRMMGTGPAYIQERDRGDVFYTPQDINAFIARNRRKA